MEKKERREGKQDVNATPTSEEESLPAMKATPDPDEDDLDDLDDLLDEFSATKVDTARQGKQPSGTDPQHLEQPTPSTSDTVTDDFSKQLQEQMAALMGEVDESPEMRREIEAMMQELGAATDPELSRKPEVRSECKGVGPDTTTSSDESFQETIRKTMNRIQASGEQATAAATSEDPEDILGQMLKEMQSGSLEGPENEEDFSKMLMGMMEQLTNKDILYEPMKELNDKFPAWMSSNKSKTKQDDLRRYESQQKLVGEIVKRFEENGYSDSHPTDREYIVERMQQMQAAGSPPADLVGDMNAAQETLRGLDSGCAQQ